MLRLLFVCHGNICRSPMAEYVTRHLVRERGLEGKVWADSAAATYDSIGLGVHYGTRQALRRHNIFCGNHIAHLLTRSDLAAYDYLIGMDAENLFGMRRILGKDPAHKIRLLLDWTSHPRNVVDPWYTGDFEATFQDVFEGCEALLDALT